MAKVVLGLAALSAAVAYLPRVPPQCFDEYQCIFHRFNVGGLEYSWDLRTLCANGGSEYVALPEGGNPNSADPNFPQIRFNVCGTVARVVAEFADASKMTQLLPFPHSHGVAVQFLENPDLPTVNPKGIALVDTDTCDQATNPLCGPTNYVSCDANNNPIQPASECNPRRQAACASSNNAQSYCKPVSSTAYPTDNAEVLAYYDGAAPVFALTDESNPQGGINLTYQGALAYNDDPFKCSGSIDPLTGLAPLRSVNINIQCNKNAKTLQVQSYTERGTCQYYIIASAAAACGSKGDPFDDPKRDSKNFGWVCLGAGLTIGVYWVYTFGESKGYWDPVHSFLAPYYEKVSGFLPAFMSGSRGGVYGSNPYKGVSTGAAATAAPISASAYGST